MNEERKTQWRSIRRVGLLASIAIYLMAVAIGSGYVFLQLWPTQPVSTGTSTSYVNVSLLIWTWSVSEEVRIIGLVLTAGAIGAVTYGLYAEFVHVARGDFSKRWALWYFARPFIGAFFGLIFYLALRAGLFSIGSPTSQLNVFGFSALAALVGMFQEETLAKFRQIAQSVLTKASFVPEQHTTGEKVPADGTFVFVKHAQSAACAQNHQGLTRVLKEDESFPAPDCGQPAIWTRLGTERA